MQHATERVERPGESQEALDGKKIIVRTEPQSEIGRNRGKKSHRFDIVSITLGN